VPGRTVEGTTAKLSEVEAELVAALPPQGQAERLLQYAISHHVGATSAVRARVNQWRGVIALEPTLNTLLDVARNGADLRVRAAAIEIELAARDLFKTVAQVDALSRGSPSTLRRPSGDLCAGAARQSGCRGRPHYDDLRRLAQSEHDLVRYQSVAAIANIGTDDTVRDLVEAFHHDTARVVRIDGGGCGLAHCGMLTRAQRMLAIPALIEMVEDPLLDAETVKYGYRALREITDETLPNSSRQWREWFAAHGAETTERFRQFDDSQRPDPPGSR
jgi:hypothetical protein